LHKATSVSESNLGNYIFPVELAKTELIYSSSTRERADNRLQEQDIYLL